MVRGQQVGKGGKIPSNNRPLGVSGLEGDKERF